ncbi:hypothetical protein DL765_003952 [Monosporascus sp. GIB2]|nr:hypothetical protein DL765_003952 [Monosporascus sp. GIB2]
MFGASPNAQPREDIESSIPLPTSVEEITTAWLSQALDCGVKEAELVKVISGTLRKILIKLEYLEENDMSQRLCTKGRFNPGLLAAYPETKATYRGEAEFYYYVAPMTQMRLPPAFHCGTDTGSGQGIVIISDMSDWDYKFDEGRDVWPAERILSGAEDLASLHAGTWRVVLATLAPEAWAARMERPPPVPPSTMCSECLLFSDWQGALSGSAFHDVSYPIANSMATEGHRGHEKAALDHYLASLHKYGGLRLTRDEIWDEYRKQMLHRLRWALTPPDLQPDEIVFGITVRTCTAVIGHQTLEPLESLPEYVLE